MGARDVGEEERDREIVQDGQEKTNALYNNINGRNALANLTLFLDLFMMWYNHLRKHQTVDRTPTEVGLF